MSSYIPKKLTNKLLLNKKGGSKSPKPSKESPSMIASPNISKLTQKDREII